MTSNEFGQFWGPPSASVDWCETNYEKTQYIAEFFNTMSSLAMATVGLLGVALHPWAEKRFKIAFFGICVVGLGSVCFHATLHKFSQALDEVPMLYSAFALLFIVLNQTYKFRKSTQQYFAYALIVYSGATTYLVTAFHGHWQFMLFHISFGSAQLYATFLTVKLYRKIKIRDGSTPATKIFERGLAYYFASFACWLIDMLACEYVNPHYVTAILPFNPQLHAWWHVFISLGVYNMALFMLDVRMATSLRTRKPKVAQILYLIDYVKIVESPKKINKK